MTLSSQSTSSRSTAGLRILAVLPDVPWPLNSGKRIREWSVVSALAAVGEVDAVTVGLDVDDFTTPPGVELRTGGSVVLSYLGKFRSGARLLSGRPWRVAVADWSPAVKRIRELNAKDYDVVWFGSLDAWVELRHIVGSAKVIVDIDDIETEKIATFLATPADGGLASRADRFQGRVERVMWSRIQRSAIHRAAAVTVCSATDANVLGTPTAAVVPNCFPVPLSNETVAVQPQTLLLVGNYSYEPNLDGAQFMAREVMPHVLRRFPEARLLLVGRGAPNELVKLGSLAGVTVIGEVESTAAFLQSSYLALAPVRFGGGTRIKLIEAFAYSLPCVSTAVGCHGLDVADSRELLIADTAQEFADACCRILGDDVLARSLGLAGHRLYEEQYQPTAVMATIRDLVVGVAGGAS